jgi:predicted transcriptional regulator
MDISLKHENYKFLKTNKENSVEEIVAKIVKDYDAPYETVEADVNKLIEKMRVHGLIEE